MSATLSNRLRGRHDRNLWFALPQLRATSTAVLLLLLINAFQAFDEFYNLLSSAGGYPPYACPPLVYLY